MTAKGFSIVVAMEKNRGIGNKGDLPWPKLKGDMKFFRELTTCPDREAVEKRWGLKAGESADVSMWQDVSANLKFAHPLTSATEDKRNAVLMGRKTWESLPENYRPLPDRFNAVLSRTVVTGLPGPDRGSIWPILDIAFRDLMADSGIGNLLVIGGGQIFGAAISDLGCNHLYITEIDAEFECDTHFPETPDFHPALSSPWIEENGIRYRFRRYDRAS